LAEPGDEEDNAAPPRRLGRLVAVATLAVVLGLGLASGVILWTDTPPKQAAGPPAQPPAVSAALPAPPPVLPPIERVSLPAPPPALPDVLPPAEAAAPPPEPTVAAAAPDEPAEEEVLATPPPAPKPPPVRRVSAAAKPRIDPGCSHALFRFQQGLPLNAAQAAHVRNGCATRR
jgi:hypothetical protein